MINFADFCTGIAWTVNRFIRTPRGGYGNNDGLKYALRSVVKHMRLFCMNDNQYISDHDRERATLFLSPYFPIKSAFEK